MPTVLRRIFQRGVTGSGTPSHIGGYTVPAATKLAVKGLSCASRSGGRAQVTVELRDNTGAVRAAFVEAAEVPIGDSLIVIGAEQTVFLEPNDRIYVTAVVGTVDVMMHFAEIT